MNPIVYRRQRDAAMLTLIHQAAHDFQAAMTKHKTVRPAITKAWQSLRRAEEAAEWAVESRELDEILSRFSLASGLAFDLLNAVDPSQDDHVPTQRRAIIALAHRLADLLTWEAAENDE